MISPGQMSESQVPPDLGEGMWPDVRLSFCCRMLCPSSLAGVTGSLDASPVVCHSLLVCPCGGGCHQGPLTTPRAQYKLIAAEELSACCPAAGPLGPAVQTLNSDATGQGWWGRPGPPGLPQYSPPLRQANLSGASDFDSHTSLTGNPLSPGAGFLLGGPQGSKAFLGLS